MSDSFAKLFLRSSTIDKVSRERRRIIIKGVRLRRTPFFLFILGNISFLIYFFVEIPEFNLKSGLRLAILSIGIFTYEIIFLTLSYYYFAKNIPLVKNKINKYLKKYPKLFYILITIVLGLTYLILNTMIEKSLLIFLRDFVIILLISYVAEIS